MKEHVIVLNTTTIITTSKFCILSVITMPTFHRKSAKNGVPGIIWVKGMRLGEGGPHDSRLLIRLSSNPRATGSGTVNDPMVS